MEEKTKPNMLKGSSRSYFFDVKKAKNGNNFLVVTESRFDKETKQSKRSSLLLFKDDLEGFIRKLKEISL